MMNIRGSMVAGMLAAIGASACCVAPLVLVSMGLGGAWVASLAGLEPLRPVFIAIAVAVFGAAGWKLYRVPEACEPGQACADPAVLRRQRVVFWAIAALAAALLTFPYYAPIFY